MSTILNYSLKIHKKKNRFLQIKKKKCHNSLNITKIAYAQKLK